jgi:hypothetical protein
MVHLTKQVTLAAVIGIIIGATAILSLRYFAYSPERTHYHANFDIYINGRREAFKNPMYYEEEAGGICSLDTAMTPGERAHMHDNVGDVVHVEDHAVTWGQFFQNLRWTVNDKLIQTPNNLYVTDEMHKITFLINGHEIQDVTPETIHDKDRLLVDFGSMNDAMLQSEFKTVPTTAVTYDEGKDPASCMSNSQPAIRERMKHLL